MQARNFTTNVPKLLDLKSSSEQLFFRELSLGAPALPPVTLLSLQFCALLCAKKEVPEEGVGTSSLTAASSNEIS